jgi:hypothetical protein
MEGLPARAALLLGVAFWCGVYWTRGLAQQPGCGLAAAGSPGVTMPLAEPPVAAPPEPEVVGLHPGGTLDPATPGGGGVSVPVAPPVVAGGEPDGGFGAAEAPGVAPIGGLTAVPAGGDGLMVVLAPPPVAAPPPVPAGPTRLDCAAARPAPPISRTAATTVAFRVRGIVDSFHARSTGQRRLSLRGSCARKNVAPRPQALFAEISAAKPVPFAL